MADVLRDACDAHPDVFLGHIGGDDFALVSPPDAARPLADAILAAFAARRPAFHDPADVERGFYEAIDRQGTVRQTPLVSLSIGVAQVAGARLGLTAAAVADRASECKRVAKRTPGDSVFVDRRGPGPGA